MNLTLLLWVPFSLALAAGYAFAWYAATGRLRATQKQAYLERQANIARRAAGQEADPPDWLLNPMHPLSPLNLANQQSSLQQQMMDSVMGQRHGQ